MNNKFSDHYIEEEFDLSKVLFIATANYIEQIPYELKDRLEIINLSSYTEYEKLDIAKKHLVKKEIIEHGLKDKNVTITDNAILTIIRNYTKEAGVRDLQRNLSTVVRKIVTKSVKEANTPIKVTLKKSTIGCKKDQIATVEALGLKKIGDVTVQPNTPQTQGKVKKISHLIEVTEA